MKIKRGSWKYAIGVPAIISLALTLMCYYYWNLRLTFGFGDMSVRVSSAIKDLVRMDGSSFDEVVAINVSYDRALIPYSDAFGIPLGEIDITDRRKLLTFLDSLSEWDNYRYVLCDINFDGGLSTEWDDALFSRIAGMRDITVACGSGTDVLHPEQIAAKLSCSTYEQFLSGDGFLKYTYLAPDGMDCMAYRMWKELDGGSINTHWWGWSSDGKLCVRSFIPDLKFVTRSDYSALGEKNLYNLGADILSEPDMSILFNDKIVLIGDFKEFDFHDTIKNSVAGTAIIYNAYLALRNGDHIVRFWILLVLFLAFGCEVFFALRNFWKEKDKTNAEKDNAGCEKPRARWKTIIISILDVCMTLIGYAGVMAIVCIILYLGSGLFVNAIIIGSLIALFSLIVEQSYKKDE